MVTVEGLDWATSHYSTAYDLTVDEFHTFYVGAGDSEVLVHNHCNWTKLAPSAYGQDDLSELTLAARRAANGGQGDLSGNYAALRTDDGRTFVGRSSSADRLDAEEVVVSMANSEGYGLDRVQALYTEYSPCQRLNRSCTLIAQTIQERPDGLGVVTYHIDYGFSGYRAARDTMLANAQVVG